MDDGAGVRLDQSPSRYVDALDIGGVLESVDAFAHTVISNLGCECFFSAK